MTSYNAILLLYIICMAKCTSSNTPVHAALRNHAEIKTSMVKNTHLTKINLVKDIVRHQAFEGLGNLLLPNDDNNAYYDTPINNIATLMPYHNAVNPDAVAAALNHLIDDTEGNQTIFYNFYSKEQKKQDPKKNYTGLFFFRGDPVAPFAIICPGGGFSYVGSLHEGLPLASEISKKKLNAFVIRYRIGSEQWATEDLANAIKFIFENADSLKVSTTGYSLWGGSAGARMVGNIAQHGVAAFAAGNCPKPATAVIAYTGQSTYDKSFPPTFVTVSANDGIANVATVDRRVQNLKNAGVTVAYERYKHAGHGFGLGTGTDAEGWLFKAVDFWKAQSKIDKKQ